MIVAPGSVAFPFLTVAFSGAGSDGVFGGGVPAGGLIVYLDPAVAVSVKSIDVRSRQFWQREVRGRCRAREDEQGPD